MKAGGVIIIEWKQKENIMVLRWFDNKLVHILSTYKGLFPLEEAKKWDRKEKDYIKVQVPHAIAKYNKFMRGLDLCDMFLELYRIDFKSKKWYMRIFFYVLDLATVNDWLLYRRTLNKKSKQHVISNLTLLHGFCLAINILQKGKDTVNKITLPKKKKGVVHPVEFFRQNGSGH